MTRQNTLLVLADGSERTMQTAHYLKEFLPVDGHTRIVLFHVFSGVPEEYRDLLTGSSCAAAASLLRSQELADKGDILQCLERARQLLIGAGYAEQDVEVKFRCLEHGVARDIMAEAKNGYTAVVLRRRGLGALGNMILGSVAVKLLHGLTFVPIILVGQAPPVKKVLLAVDNSPHSMRAVEFAGSMLGGPGYEVCAFHAVEGLGAIRFGLAAPGGQERSELKLPDSCIEAFKVKIARLMQTVKHMLLDAGFDPAKISERVLSGVRIRSEAIVQEAEAGGYGTIIVGRRGLSRVEAFFLGRVSHAVVHAGNRFSVWIV